MTDDTTTPPVLFQCTCGPLGRLEETGHFFHCPAIRYPMYRKMISDIKYKQLISGIHLKKGAGISIEQMMMFDIHPDEKEIMPLKIGEAGNALFRSFCAETTKNSDPQNDVPYLLNWTMGGGDLEGVITTVLVIVRHNDEWNLFHLYSPAVYKYYEMIS